MNYLIQETKTLSFQSNKVSYHLSLSSPFYPYDTTSPNTNQHHYKQENHYHSKDISYYAISIKKKNPLSICPLSAKRYQPPIKRTKVDSLHPLPSPLKTIPLLLLSQPLLLLPSSLPLLLSFLQEHLYFVIVLSIHWPTSESLILLRFLVFN